tara:strand:- start:2019 stop:2486 length:468 start_codon:yes stop_codon:yes gene_type:complete
MTKTSLFIIFFLLLIGIGGVGYQQLQITRLSERLNQEENCNFALTMVSLARITKDFDSSQSNDIWISQGQKLSKRIYEKDFWFFPDVTMEEIGLKELLNNSSDNLSFEDFFSTNNLFSDGLGIWFGMINMWDTSWKAKDGTKAISPTDVIDQNCK